MEECMQKARTTILPIIAVIFVFFFGWSTISAQTIEKLTNQLRDVEQLPSGTVFQIIMTDDDLTDAAGEYLNIYKGEIHDMIQQSTGIKVDLSDPKIEFDENFMVVSINGGIGFLKVQISANGTVFWDKEASRVKVNVQSVDVPIISIDPATINAYIEEPINAFVQDLLRGYDIHSFEIKDDYAIIEAMKR